MDETQHGRVGVREVARAAGVSTQTVSRVINEHPNIRPETRERVLEAIATLGYRVNNAARALGTRTTRTLGVIASDATLYGPSVGIAALERAARAAGRWIATAYADAEVEASVVSAADRLLAQGVDGLVVLAPHVATLATLQRVHAGVRIEALHTGIGADRQREGGALAAEHLLALGHRSIARVSGPDDWLEAVAREAGVDRALAAAGAGGRGQNGHYASPRARPAGSSMTDDRARSPAGEPITRAVSRRSRLRARTGGTGCAHAPCAAFGACGAPKQEPPPPRLCRRPTHPRKGRLRWGQTVGVRSPK